MLFELNQLKGGEFLPFKGVYVSVCLFFREIDTFLNFFLPNLIRVTGKILYISFDVEIT